MKLPLFPLDTVLFPGCMLDLQIFEARYLDMVSQCLKAGHGFGVVHILDGSEVGAAPASFARVGCEALIRDWQQLPNGLLGIRVEGGRRFDVQTFEVLRDQLTVAQVAWRNEGDALPLAENTLTCWCCSRRSVSTHGEPWGSAGRCAIRPRWPASWPICCRSRPGRRSNCLGWTTRSCNWRRFRTCSSSCRKGRSGGAVVLLIAIHLHRRR